MSTSPNALIATAVARLGVGDVVAAEEALVAARELVPHHPQIHYLLAEAALVRGDRPAALRHAAASVGCERKRPEPLLLLGQLVYQAGDSLTAGKLFERALQLAPGLPAAQAAWQEALRHPVATSRHPELEPLTRRPTVSLCVVVRDDARGLARCLRAAKPHVDELVVVGPGEALDVAAEQGATAVGLPGGDLAAARNQALAAATGDWALMLEADEELKAPPGQLQELLGAMPWPDVTGLVPVVSLRLANGAGTAQRLFPRAAVRYASTAPGTPALAPGRTDALYPMSAQSLEIHPIEASATGRAAGAAIELVAPSAAAGRVRPVPPWRIAVVTPYGQEPIEVLRRCHDSVLAQTVEATHVFVADGFPREAIDGWEGFHHRLPRPHGDDGHTARFAGAVSALSQGYDAIAFLDPGATFAPDHLESLVATHLASGSAVCIAGSPDDEGAPAVGAYLFTPRAHHLLPRWGMLDPAWAPLAEQLFHQVLVAEAVTRAYTHRRTLVGAAPPAPERVAAAWEAFSSRRFFERTGVRVAVPGREEPPARPAGQRIAVITPYYQEPIEALRRCHDSVRAQTVPATHFFVADGHPLAELDGWDLEHLKLSQAHADYGNTPRCIGSICALNEGYDAVVLLDADNFFAPDHLESLVAAHRDTGAPIGASNRHLAMDDGTVIDQEVADDLTREHVDTSCFMIWGAAAYVLPVWGMMPKELSPICDRIFFRALAYYQVPIAGTDLKTVYFTVYAPEPYLAAGRPAPESDHTVDWERLVSRYSAQRVVDRLGAPIPFPWFRDASRSTPGG